MMDPVPKAVAVQVIVLVALFGAAYAQTVTFAPLTSTAVGAGDIDNTPIATCQNYLTGLRTFQSTVRGRQYVNFGYVYDADLTSPNTRFAAQPVPSKVAVNANGRYVLDQGSENPVPMPNFRATVTLPGSATPPLSFSLDFDFSIVPWVREDETAAYRALVSEGWDYLSDAQRFPRYQTRPGFDEVGLRKRAFETVWPLSPFISVKYKAMGYTGTTRVTDTNAPNYKRALKYSLAVVTPSNIDVSGAESAGSVTGSTTNDYDREFNRGYFQGPSADTIETRYSSYQASHTVADRTGGPAKYWNLSPLLTYINNGRTRFMPYTAPPYASNPWDDFDNWVYQEAAAGVRARGLKTSVVYVMRKFIYCDTQATITTPRAATITEMAPKFVLFYAYSPYSQRGKFGFVTNWPDA